jgi:hypothetical protein
VSHAESRTARQTGFISSHPPRSTTTLRRRAPEAVHPAAHAGVAARGGRRARRHQRELVHPTGAGQGRPGLPQGAARHRRGAAAQRGGTLGLEPSLPSPETATVSDTLQALLDAQGERPAYVVDPCLNLLAWNQAANDVFGAGAGFFGEFGDLPKHERNLLWLIFTDEARRFFVHWERHARLLLAQFRDASRHFVGDPWIDGLVEQLKARDPQFAEWWSRHDVERVQEIEKLIHHPRVGPLALRQTVSQIVDDSPGLFLVLYTPAPDTDTAERLQKLAIDSART